METHIKKPRVEPGSQTWRLTRKEVCEIIFTSIYGRKPTPEEIQRLNVDVTDNYDRGRGESKPEWLSLSLTDIPPILNDVAQS